MELVRYFAGLVMVAIVPIQGVVAGHLFGDSISQGVYIGLGVGLASLEAVCVYLINVKIAAAIRGFSVGGDKRPPPPRRP